MKDLSITEVIKEFAEILFKSFNNRSFVKLTLSKPIDNDNQLMNVYVRSIALKQETVLSFTYRYKTNDQVKNYGIEDAIEKVKKMLHEQFKIASLFTTDSDIICEVNKKGKASIRKSKASFSDNVVSSHDKEKKRMSGEGDSYLIALGISDKQGNIIPKMSDKYKQINKYLEIIESLIKDVKFPERINVIDMGSGKGYLTFALYDYLHNKLNLNISVTGIELREDLVKYCNQVAVDCGFNDLKFECKPIDAVEDNKIDILIALHACDTATDDALRKGIISKAQLVVCAPCCHKQIRQQLKGKEQENPILKYGIFKERQCEMVTDTIRALILEKYQYETKIFEFISNEHTRKNVMLVGVKSERKIDVGAINDKITLLKKEYGIDYHFLEKALS